MNIKLYGKIVEVGQIEDEEGVLLGTGARLSLMTAGEEEDIYLPATPNQCRELGALLYRDVVITIEQMEVGK